MRFLIAPDKFKGSLSAQEVARTIEKGVKKVFPKAQTKLLPLADGGDGTAAILGETLGAKFYSTKVHGPLGEPVQARYAVKAKTAYLDFASACGLSMLTPARRNPMKTSSNGVGELMLYAIKRGAKEIVIGVGGSATVDGGIGALTALGIKFLDKSEKQVQLGGQGLRDIYSIDAKGCLLSKKIKILILSDVQNPLLGKRGSAAVFGPQKGATPAMVKELERGLTKLNQALVREGGKSVATLSAGGAAGGIVAGFTGVLGGLVGIQVKAVSGIDYVMRALQIEKHLKWCDCVITGEGKLDRQTLDGKTVGGIARLGCKHRKPVLAAAGRLDLRESELNRLGLSMAWSIAKSSVPVAECIRNARPWLEKSTSRALLEAMASA
jgi:glycerate 2-kinase